MTTPLPTSTVLETKTAETAEDTHGPPGPPALPHHGTRVTSDTESKHGREWRQDLNKRDEMGRTTATEMGTRFLANGFG